MTALPAVEHRITVALAPERAFDLFTQGLVRWWPFKGHSCSGEGVQAVLFDGRVGGAVTELAADGSRHAWGTLTEWDPPAGFAMTWHPGDSPHRATHLVLRFSAVAGGCEVHVRHGGWESSGEEAEARRGGYQNGWGRVLGDFAAAAAREAMR